MMADTGSGLSWLAAGIAALGASIAWGQYYVARQKLAFDLFDKRLNLWKRFVDEQIRIEQEGTPGLNSSGRFASLIVDSQFLFGLKVVTKLKDANDCIKRWSVAQQNSQRDGIIGEVGADYAKKMQMNIDGFSKCMEDAHLLLLCYMRMDQKLPRPPKEWPSMFIAWLNQCSNRLILFIIWLKHRWANRPIGE